MMKHRIFTLLVIPMLVDCVMITQAVEAGDLSTETFGSSAGGWQDRDTGRGVVSHESTGGNPEGCLRIVFGPQAVTFPDVDAVVASGQPASNDFLGDYQDAEAMVLGFDFKAEQVLPSALWVKIHAGGRAIYRDVTPVIQQIGAWNSVRISLLASGLGGWLGDVDAFADILTGVDRVEFQMTRFGEKGQAYYLDNIFLDRLPAASLSGVGLHSSGPIAWDYLRVGARYRSESTSDLNHPSWQVLESFTATTDVFEARHTITNDTVFYRLLME